MRKKYRDRIGPRIQEIATTKDISPGEIKLRILTDHLLPGDLLGEPITYGLGYYLLQGLRLLFPVVVTVIFIDAAITAQDWGYVGTGLVFGGFITHICLTSFREDRKETAEWIEQRRFAQQELLFDLPSDE